MNSRKLLLILLAGTAIRFMYGYFSKAWLAAPDQLAWGLGIDEMLNNKAWSYTHLSHAPHEGGGFFIALLSILFRPLQSILPSLSFAALAVDTLSRFIQVKMAQKIWGNKTAFWFGIWTILSIPILIPWATVNFGLHSLFSFVPFVFFYFAHRYRENRYLPVVCGIICAVAVSFSYDSAILVPVSVLFLVAVNSNRKNTLPGLLIFFATFAIAVLPHLVARSFYNTAVSLTGGSYFSARGVSLNDLFSARHFLNFCVVWFTSFPGSFLLSSINFLPAILLCGIIFLFLFTGIRSYILNKPVQKITKLLAAGIIFLFITAYAFSPFYGRSYSNKSYVYYRHLCYIIPFVVVIMINGFILSGRLKTYLLTGWMVVCGIASCQYMLSARKIEEPAYKAAGWVLAKKYGNDVPALLRIHSVADARYREEILKGYGWGFSAALFQDSKDSASVNKLVSLISQFPGKDQAQLIDGVYYSFGSGITPVLDKKWIPVINFHLSQKKYDPIIDKRL